MTGLGRWAPAGKYRAVEDQTALRRPTGPACREREATGMTTYGGKEITCADCGRKFLWPAKEQELYAAKGYPPPSRCKECKQAQRVGPRQPGGGERR